MFSATSHIEAIITNEDEVRLSDSLHGGAAQTFIDVVQEVRLYTPSFPWHRLIALVLFDSVSFNLSPSHKPGIRSPPSPTAAPEEVLEFFVSYMRSLSNGT